LVGRDKESEDWTMVVSSDVVDDDFSCIIHFKRYNVTLSLLRLQVIQHFLMNLEMRILCN
jgi:hypothetical protein